MISSEDGITCEALNYFMLDNQLSAASVAVPCEILEKLFRS